MDNTSSEKFFKKSSLEILELIQNESKENNVIKSVHELENKENKFQNEASNSQLDIIPLENLKEFYEYLQTVISRANHVLSKAYENKLPMILKNRLERKVKELLAIEKELRTISYNVDSLKTQIDAIKKNTREQKKELKRLKWKENHKKVKLTNEENKVRNVQRQKSLLSITSQYRQNGQTQLIPWFASIESECAHHVSFNKSDTNINKNRTRPIAFPRKTKQHQLNRPKIKEIQEDESEEGVTLYLTPIESERNESNSHITFENNSSSSTTSHTVIDWSWVD